MAPKLYEAARGFFDFTLIYGDRWSQAPLRGKPVPRSAVSKVFFSLKDDIADTDAIVSLSDEDISEIEWLDEENGKVRVKLGEKTEGHTGEDKPYELRLKMCDGSWITAFSGLLTILPSVVGTPE